jgi:hypothetical protein
MPQKIIGEQRNATEPRSPNAVADDPKAMAQLGDFDALVIATLLVLTSRAGNCP